MDFRLFAAGVAVAAETPHKPVEQPLESRALTAAARVLPVRRRMVCCDSARAQMVALGGEEVRALATSGAAGGCLKWRTAGVETVLGSAAPAPSAAESKRERQKRRNKRRREERRKAKAQQQQQEEIPTT